VTERRHTLENLIETTGAMTAAALQKAAQPLGFTWHEIDLYFQLRDARVFRGDLYERIADIETALHDFVRQILVQEFGATEAGWWRQGVPKIVRIACVQAREEDAEPIDDPFAYTTLTHLGEVIDRNWRLFAAKLPSALAADKQGLLRALRRLNTLRNAVMHPVKRRTWTREDLSSSQASKENSRLTSQSTGPGLALLAPAGDRPRSQTMLRDDEVRIDTGRARDGGTFVRVLHIPDRPSPHEGPSRCGVSCCRRISALRRT